MCIWGAPLKALVLPRNKQARAETLHRDILMVKMCCETGRFFAGSSSCADWAAALHGAAAGTPHTSPTRLRRDGAHSPAQLLKTNPSWLLQLHQLSAPRYLMSWSSCPWAPLSLTLAGPSPLSRQPAPATHRVLRYVSLLRDFTSTLLVF